MKTENNEEKQGTGPLSAPPCSGAAAHLPILTESQVKACANIIHAVQYRIGKYPVWIESYTPYPPSFTFGMEKCPEFKTFDEAADYVAQKGWRLLPRQYIRAESLRVTLAERQTQRTRRGNAQQPRQMTDTGQPITKPEPAGSPRPFWATHPPDPNNDDTCCKCGRSVIVEPDAEWLGPDDNWHWNLCHQCAHDLVFMLWGKLQANDKLSHEEGGKEQL